MYEKILYFKVVKYKYLKRNLIIMNEKPALQESGTSKPLDLSTGSNFNLSISPSKIDDILGRACPQAQGSAENASGIWSTFHTIYNAKIARALKKVFAKITVQHEIKDGNGRLDIRLVTGYQNKVEIGMHPVVVIELKTGGLKLFQACEYAIRNKCPVILIELLSGDIHVIKLNAAYEIMAEAKKEMEDIQQIKEYGATIPGQDCKWCIKNCPDRIVPYAPYRPDVYTFQDRACILKNNYPRAVEKLLTEIQRIIREKEREQF
jgi:hypothetical protein